MLVIPNSNPYILKFPNTQMNDNYNNQAIYFKGYPKIIDSQANDQQLELQNRFIQYLSGIYVLKNMSTECINHKPVYFLSIVKFENIQPC